ncbi:MAG: hypothetical protein C0478_16625, partial [Planctomyces sp.]|nr:hypothetical protein [Planctomyces sp.]
MPELLVKEGNGPSRVVPLTKTQPVMIGSLEFNEIVVPGDNIPAVVCRVSWSGSGFEITVAGAPSVSVNGRNVSRAELSTGDVIAIGSLVIRYEDGAAPNNQAMPGKASEKPNASVSKSPPSKSPAPQPVIIEELSASFSDLPSLPNRGPSSETKPERGWRSNAVRPAPLGSLKGRPGEEDLLRSPFVLGMSITVGILLIAGIVTLFLIQQRSLEREFGLAEVEFKEGRFAQAYERFHRFATDHPGAKRTSEARRFAWRSSIERELVGASPAHARAFEQLQKWILDDRDSPDFKEIRPDLQRAAERIATGSAIEAAARADAPLLGISDEATRLVERYTEDRTELTASISRIEQLRQNATRSIAKQQALEATLASMKALLGRGDSLGALAAHRQLLGRFPDLAKSVDLGKLVEEALVVEKDRVAP